MGTAIRSTRIREVLMSDNEHWFARDHALPEGEKRCYSGRELDRFKKTWRFEMTNHKGEVDDVTNDVEELWEQGGRGFYSVLLTKAGPPEVCCFNIPGEIQMVRR